MNNEHLKVKLVRADSVHTPGLRGQGEQSDLELQFYDLVTNLLSSSQGLRMTIR